MFPLGSSFRRRRARSCGPRLEARFEHLSLCGDSFLSAAIGLVSCIRISLMTDPDFSAPSHAVDASQPASAPLPVGWEAAPLPVTLISASGTVSAIGSGAENLRQALCSGKSGLAPARELPPSIDAPPFEACVGVVPFELERAPASEPFADTRQLRLAWHAISQFEETLRSAVTRWGGPRVGLILGTSTGGILSTEQALIEARRTGALPVDYSCQYGHNMDAAAHYLARQFGLFGPVYAVSAACASGAKALASGRRWIELGICDAVVAGGVDSICRMTLHGFHSLGVLSSAECRPFQPEQHGMNVAEGATLFLMERAVGSVTSRDIALVGVGESSDAFHMSAPDPSGASQGKALLRSLTDAGVDPKSVRYVNAHGTGTRANDTAEALCLASVVAGVPASSIKGIVGHQLGAAGSTEALAATLVLQGSTISSSGALSSEAFPLTLPAGGVVMSNSFAFGGANISLCFASGAYVAERARACSPVRSAGIAASAYFVGTDGGCEDLGRDLFVGRARARAPELTRLGAHLIVQLGLSKEELADVPLIVGSALGQIRTTRRLIGLFLENDSSPLAFQNSVHNAVSGALALALSNKKPSSSVAGGDDTSFCALLEGLSYLWTEPQEERVVVLCVEESPPDDMGVADYPTSGAAFLLHRDTPNFPLSIGLCEKALLPPEIEVLRGVFGEPTSLSPEAVLLARRLQETRWKSPDPHDLPPVLGILSSRSEFALCVAKRAN